MESIIKDFLIMATDGYNIFTVDGNVVDVLSGDTLNYTEKCLLVRVDNKVAIYPYCSILYIQQH